MTPVNQSFQAAPLGRRVIWGTLVAGIITLVVPSITLYALVSDPHRAAFPSWPSKAFTGFIPFVILVPSFLWQRSRASQLEVQDNVLVVCRKRFPLAGLVEVTRDPEVLHRARRVWGNGGLGSIRGTYSSKRIGKFQAFLTDTDHAVVLRWPDKVVAVSPADTEFFILMARTAAGLR